jgi:carbamoylphosphate synthase large subunit
VSRDNGTLEVFLGDILVNKVLIWPGTGIIGSEVFDSLKYMKNIELTLATDSQDLSIIEKKTSTLYIPNVHEKLADWEKIFDQIEYTYDLIFPTNDFVIDLIVNYESKNFDKYVLPPIETVKLCRSKKLTAQFFKNKIPVLEEIEIDIIKFPVYFKPDKGYGAKDHQIIYNHNDLNTSINRNPDFVINEILEGKEYTVECFTDFTGKLLYSNPRLRERIQFATSTKLSKPSNNSKIELQKYAQIINNSIKLEGPWFFQMKSDAKGNLKLLEIGIRVPGSAIWSRATGVNLSELAVYNKNKVSTSIIPNNGELTIERNLRSFVCLKLEFKYVYIDFDDTIYVKGKVTEESFIFLNKCFFRGVKVILITKYLGNDLINKLKDLRIHSLFTEIIHISQNDSKYIYMKYLDSIFIDDSFYERQLVLKNLKIDTYGPDIMELI